MANEPVAKIPTASMFQYVRAISLFQDVECKVKEEQGAKRPWWLCRSVWGAVVAAVAYALATFAGVNIVPDDLNTITDDLTKLAENVPVIYGICLSIYGIASKTIKAFSAPKC